MLGTLLTAKGDDGELLSRAVVLDNVYGMFFAGHSTVSSSICNLLQYVARSPETTAAVAAEVLSWPEEERRKGGPLNLKCAFPSSHRILRLCRSCSHALGRHNIIHSEESHTSLRLVK